MKKHIFVMAELAIVLALLMACASPAPNVDNPPPVVDNPPAVTDDQHGVATNSPKEPQVPDADDVQAAQPWETKPEGVAEAGDDIPPEYAGRTVIILATKTESRLGYYDGSLGKMLQAFHEAQDEVYIQAKFFQESGTTYLIPLERIYAQIINGDQADLYYTGGYELESEKLANAGLIQDWYPVMEADPAFQISDYLTSVWRTLESGDGQLFELCSGYTLRYALRVPEPLAEGLDSYDGFLAYLKENDLTLSQERALGEGSYYLDWIDMETLTCDFQSESFIEWLHFIAALAPEKNQNTDVRGGEIANLPKFMQVSEDAGCWQRYIEIPSRYPHMPRVSPWDSFSLSSTTEHLDACMKFIKWLLSYDTQQQFYGGVEGETYEGYFALPVNRAVWERNLERIQLSGEDDATIIGLKKVVRPIPMYPDLKQGDFRPGLPAEEAEYIRQMVENVDRRQIDSSDASIIFWQEMEVFRQGDITAEECAERLQMRFTIYLAERK